MLEVRGKPRDAVETPTGDIDLEEQKRIADRRWQESYVVVGMIGFFSFRVLCLFF